jgi:16S rRNA (guanine(966)-N(2))-methyltransferase RsmD
MKRTVRDTYDIPITGGRLKGRKIALPKVATTRSSKAILRQSLFNTLQFEIVDALFVEAFAGSGSVGIEALSRGAARAIFFEQNRQALTVLHENIRRLELENAEVIAGDTFEQFPRFLERLGKESRPIYFYFDPPFSIRDGMGDIYERTLALIAAIEGTERTVIIEHMSTLTLPERIGDFVHKRTKRFGKSALSYFLSADGD